MGFGDSLRNAMDRLRTSSIDKETVKESVKELQRALISADVEIPLVLKLSKEIEAEAFRELPEGLNRREHIIKTMHGKLAEILGGSTQPPEKPKRILLVGLFGAGKTTQCGKLAKWYSKRGMKVGLIAADVFRPAATEQLRTLAERAKAEFYGNENEKNAAKVVREGMEKLKSCDLLICDSAGRNALDEELSKEIRAIDSAFNAEEKWLVIGADVGQVAKKQSQAFHDLVGVNGVIITRMDGSAKGGGCLAACKSTGAKVYFIGMGERIDDLQEFDATRYLSRVMGYGDLQGLLEKAKEAQEEEGIEVDAEDILAGNFDLQAFYLQLKAARKMGPLNKVMDLMGFGKQVPKEITEMGEQKLNKYGYIIDSMTLKERKDPDTINKSRISRIAHGAGVTQEEVRELLKNFKRMKKVFSKIGEIDEKDIGEGQGMNVQKLQRMFAKKKKFKIR
ncbi:Signal recognition particle 54 kDa protein [uncultured archaeon]|nr:Signal recognition particle 54 kDa protein [uncultured archaeon]